MTHTGSLNRSGSSKINFLKIAYKIADKRHFEKKTSNRHNSEALH